MARHALPAEPSRRAPRHAEARRRIRSGHVLLASCLTIAGLVVIPGTDATNAPKRHQSAAELPALPSAAPRKLVPTVSTGVPSAKRVRGRRLLGWAPPATTAVSPANGATFTTLTPTLTVSSVTDPDGDPVSYRFKVTTFSDAESGTIVLDTSVGSPSLTVPVGSLKDGVTYYWHVYTADAEHPAGTPPDWVRWFRVDLRLGSRNTFAMDSIGPATVNLSTGNLVVGVGSASVASLGGAVGVQFSYNSLAPVVEPGLTGAYTVDADADREWDAGELPTLVRRDPSVAFDWGTGAPTPGLPPTNLLVRWTGTVTVPVSGTYQFGATTSDGVRIHIDNALVVDSWTTQAAGAPVYGSSSALSAGSPVPITVEWFKGATAGSVIKLNVRGAGGTTFAESLVGPSWLRPEATPLPARWTMSAGSGVGYVRAEVSDGRVVLVRPDGSTHVYTSTGTGYTPPKGQDGVLARDGNGRLTLAGSDGITYVFAASGTLESATSASGAKASSHRYTWTTASGQVIPRLTGITDPVSNRSVTLRYGGDSSCPGSPPSGFDASAPTGMLCAIELWDGRTTELRYVSGQLARVQNPGSAVTDFAYDTDGRITRIRDEIAADMVAGGHRADNDTTRTLIAYDTSSRVSSVTLAEPTAGADRPGHSYDYVSATETQVDVAGLTTPSGWARKITTDVNGRQLTEVDAMNLTTSYSWDDGDRPVATTAPTGLRATTIYDHAGRPIEAYGPAPAGWFGGDDKPLSAYTSRVAKSTTAYDEGLKGLDALYFDNKGFAGEPVGHEILGDGTGALNKAWSTVPTGVTGSEWSARITGEIVMSSTGSYVISPNVAGRARIYIDDLLVLDTSTAPTATYSNTGEKHRLRIEYSNDGPTWQTFSFSGGAQSWVVPAGVTSVAVEAWGGAGSAADVSAWAAPGAGGQGGYAKGTLAVTPGESLQLNVGGAGVSTGAGGWNGGGNGGNGWGGAGGAGGGGGSDVRRGGTALSNRVIVGGGGGGGGGHYSSGMTGGAGGASTGAPGGWGLGRGSGGTQSAGGDSGTDGYHSSYPGALAVGGAGSYWGGGGGGGGFYGGGAGYNNNDTYIGGGGGGSNLVTGTTTTSTQGGRTGNGQITLTWQTSSLPTVTYLYSGAGRVTREAATATARQRDYTYDAVGRLTTTVEGAATRRYAYDANTNRCGLATSCESAWVYDAADRITASPYASAYSYDTHGNLTASTGTTGNPSAAISYDAKDHAIVVNDGTTTITETLAPSGRVLRRVVTTNATSAVVEDISYGYAGGGDSPAYSRPTAGTTVTTYLTGLGGLVDVGGTGTWSLYNAHGDVLGTTNVAGAYTAAPQSDEFGVGATPADRLGWLGGQQRPSVGGGLGLFRMGVRLYDPRLGGFLEVDPVEGGSANDYDYCSGDPVNCFDLGGTMRTPEGKTSSSLSDFYAYVAKHPETKGYFAALVKKEDAISCYMTSCPQAPKAGGGGPTLRGTLQGVSTVSGGVAIVTAFIPGAQGVSAVAGGVSALAAVGAEAAKPGPCRAQRVTVTATYQAFTGGVGGLFGAGGAALGSAGGSAAATGWSPGGGVSC